MNSADTLRVSAQRLEFAFSPNQLAAFFAALVAGLVGIHTVIQTVRFVSGNDRLFGLVYMFSLGADGNVPTLYSSFALLFCAFLLAAIASRTVTSRAYWWILALVFVFLTLDESLEIHEKLIAPLRERLHTTGLLYYAWVIPYGVGAAVFGLAYLRFLARLPRRTAWLFVISGLTYVAGAIGMEMAGGLLFVEAGSDTAAYVFVQSIEEILEMSGIVLFIYTLADYMGEHCGGLALNVGRT